MQDYREILIKDLTTLLYTKGIDINTVAGLQNSITMLLDSYDISQRVTAIALRDTSSDKVIKVYAGSLLTEGKSKRTVEEYIRLLKTLYYEVGKSLLELNTSDIRIWLAKMQSKASLRTCENYRSYISAFYKWLVMEEYLDKNPCTRIKPIKYDDIKKFAYSDIELDKLRSSCVSKRERAIIELLLASGMRANELCNMCLDDVNFMNNELVVRHGKGGKQRVTYMNPIANLYLREYIESRNDSNPSLFISRLGHKLTVNSLEAEIRKLGTRANVVNTHPHRFRRTFATTMAKKGMAIQIIQQLMGHSNINTTMRYISLSANRIQNEYERFV